MRKAYSIGLSLVCIPCRDFNHCRFLSSSEINDMGVPQMKLAKQAKSSYVCGGVSTITKSRQPSWSASPRREIRGGGEARLLMRWPK